MTLATNTPLVDRVRYAIGSLNPDELIDALEQLAEFERIATNYNCDNAEDLEAMIESLEQNQENEDHKSFDDYKEFFDDVVSVWTDNFGNGRWPCPEPWDDNMRAAMFTDIEEGARALAAEKERGES